MNLKNLKLLRTWAEKQGRFPRPHSFLANAFSEISPRMKQKTPSNIITLSKTIRVLYYILVFNSLKRKLLKYIRARHYKRSGLSPQKFFGLPDSIFRSFNTGSLFDCPHCYDWRKSGEPKIEDYIYYIDWLIEWEENRLYRLTLKHQYYPYEEIN